MAEPGDRGAPPVERLERLDLQQRAHLPRCRVGRVEDQAIDAEAVEAADVADVLVPPHRRLPLRAVERALVVLEVVDREEAGFAVDALVAAVRQPPGAPEDLRHVDLVVPAVELAGMGVLDVDRHDVEPLRPRPDARRPSGSRATCARGSRGCRGAAKRSERNGASETLGAADAGTSSSMSYSEMCGRPSVQTIATHPAPARPRRASPGRARSRTSRRTPPRGRTRARSGRGGSCSAQHGVKSPLGDVLVRRRRVRGLRHTLRRWRGRSSAERGSPRSDAPRRRLP